MQDKLKIIEQIKNYKFNQFNCRLWVIKKSSRNGKNTYKALYAAISGLDKDFKDTLKHFFCGLEEVVEPIQQLQAYAPITVDTDEDRALIHSLEDTDFNLIIKKIKSGADNKPVQDIKQFNNAWALVIEYTKGEDRFYSFSKVKGGWNIKRSNSAKNWVFNEGHFEKVEAKKIFSFRNSIDFVAYGNDVFIRDKANYELGLNIREGLLAKRDELVEAFANNGIITSVDDLKIAIGTNKTLLRKLVAVEESRYFEDQQFIEDMKVIIDKHGWDVHLPSDDYGKFIIDQNNIDLFLKLINDKRFLSLIKRQMVDADAVVLVKEA